MKQTRASLCLTGTQYPSSAVQRDLEWLNLVHGKPGRIVSDNGPEFRSLKLPEGVKAGVIQPGNPWQNGCVESFFDKLRDEALNREIFTCAEEAETTLDAHMDDDNHRRPHRRPHRSLKGLAPSSFKALMTEPQMEAELTL